MKLLVMIFCLIAQLSAVLGEDKVSDWGKPVDGLRMRVHYSDITECYRDERMPQGVNTYIRCEVENVSDREVSFTPSVRMFTINDQRENRTLQYSLKEVPTVFIAPERTYDWYQHVYIKDENVYDSSYVMRSNIIGDFSTVSVQTKFVLVDYIEANKRALKRLQSNDVIELNFYKEVAALDDKGYRKLYYRLRGEAQNKIEDRSIGLSAYDFSNNLTVIGGKLTAIIKFRVPEFTPFLHYIHGGNKQLTGFAVLNNNGENLIESFDYPNLGFKIKGEDNLIISFRKGPLSPSNDYYLTLHYQSPWSTTYFDVTLSPLKDDYLVFYNLFKQMRRIHDPIHSYKESDNYYDPTEFDFKTDWSDAVDGVKLRIHYDKNSLAINVDKSDSDSFAFCVRLELLNIGREKTKEVVRNHIEVYQVNSNNRKLCGTYTPRDTIPLGIMKYHTAYENYTIQVSRSDLGKERKYSIVHKAFEGLKSPTFSVYLKEGEESYE